MSKQIIKIIFIFAVFFVLPLASQAFVEPPTINIIKPTPTATYYIDSAAAPGGNGTEGAPWDDIMDANNHVISGALIKIKGVFSAWGQVQQTWSQSGTEGNEIVFEPWDNNTATILYPLGIGWAGTGNYIIFDGGPNRNIVFDGHALNLKTNLQTFGSNILLYRIKISNNLLDLPGSLGTNLSIGSGSNNLRIYNCEITNSTSAGLYVQGGDNIEVRNNLIHGNYGAGFQINPHTTGHTATNITIEGNAFYNNGYLRAGGRSHIEVVNTLYTDDTSYVKGVLIANNTIWDGNIAGIHICNSEGGIVGGVEVYNNTIYSNVNDGIILSACTSRPGFDSPVIKNNIIYQVGGELINNAGGLDYISSNNLFTNPNFLSVDSVSQDFLRLNSSSGAIDTGMNVDIAGDFLDTPRPQGSDFDIGAYEYSVGQADTTSPNVPSGVNVN
jgi:parallel beta-helix repeat protein